MDDISSDAYLKSIADDVSKLLERLQGIWKVMGFNQEVVTSRFGLVVQHFGKMVMEMIAEAEAESAELEGKVKELLALKQVLKSELNLNESHTEEEWQQMSLCQMKSALEEDVKGFKAVINDRKSQVYELLEAQADLCTSMGIEERQLFVNPLPTEKQLQEFRAYLDQLSTKKFTLEEEFIQKRMEICDMVRQLDFQPVLRFHEQILNEPEQYFIYSEHNMKQLNAFHSELAQMVAKLEENVADYREKLQCLWQYIGQNLEGYHEFNTKYTAVDKRTLDALKEEIGRCEAFKSENMKTFIAGLRQDIRRLWRKCRLGDDDKLAFLPFFNSATFNEDVLELHEMEVQRLDKYYKENAGLLDLAEERAALLDKKARLEDMENDPKRLKNRGGALLKEEKERRAIDVKLPKIEERMLAMAAQYEAQKGTPFTIDGVSVAEQIEEDWKKFKEAKSVHLSAKKQAREIFLTPGLSIARPSPGASLCKRKLQYTPCPSTAAKRSRILNQKRVSQTDPVGLRVNSHCFKSKVSLDRSRRRAAAVRARRKISLTDQEAIKYEEFESNLHNDARSSAIANNNPSTPKKARLQVPTLKLTKCKDRPFYV